MAVVDSAVCGTRTRDFKLQIRLPTSRLPSPKSSELIYETKAVMNVFESYGYSNMGQPISVPETTPK